MKYVSGPHTSDYYLLLDEQSEHLFDSRLAGHMREADGVATATLVEMWIDEEKQVWYMFQAGARQ